MPASHLSHRTLVRLSPQEEGEDVVGFLQGLLTNDLSGELPVYAALLTAQGKTMFDMIVWPGEPGELLLDCEAEQADELVKRLSLYRLRRKITIARDDSVGVHWQKEPGDGGAPDPRLGDLGERWLSPITGDEESVDAQWRAHRLSLGVPEGPAEMADILWLETNAVELNGVSFAKGCYIGQENTARMNWRQKVNRRLVVVPSGSAEEKRVKVDYSDLGLAVAHLRVDDIPADMVPDWMTLEAPEG